MNNDKLPSIFRIVQIDYIASIAFIFPCVIWGLYLLLTFFGTLPNLRGGAPVTRTEGQPIFFEMGIAATLLGVIGIAWRVLYIKGLFEHGIQVNGRIISASFFKDRGRVEYCFPYQGEEIRAGNAVMKMKRTEGLFPGMPVVIVVDRENPKKAVIRDLYG